MSFASIVVVAVALAALPVPKEVAARYAAAVVVVERSTSGGLQKSQGFFVSSSGLLCTVLPGAKAGDVVMVRGDEAQRGAVAAVDDEGLALVQVQGTIDPARPWAALGVSVTEKPSTWMVGLWRDKDGVQGASGGVEHRLADKSSEERWLLLLPAPRGAPIVDSDNAVVAIAMSSRGGGSIDALPVRRLKQLAARLPKS